MVSRREFLHGMCATGALAMASTLYPGMTFASAGTEQRLVVVILRGGMDGLAALVPYGDPNYANIRGDLALNSDTLLRVDPFFGFHPNLTSFAELYKKGEMIAIPAAASPYRERSHFDAQNVLELGGTRPNSLDSGWLNRLIAAIPAQHDLGLAVGQGVPTIMRGAKSVNSWAPSALPDSSNDYMSLIEKIYQHDPVFHDNYAKAVDLQIMGMDALDGDEKQMARKSRSPQGFVTMAEIAGQWMAKPDGPRIATLELGGWDTHVQQGTEGGRLANNLDILSRGINSLKSNLGSAWSKTVVVCLTEFGRTARANGTRGTDHGTASTVFLMGGALKGGRIVHQWPGMAENELYQNRDLRPTIDIRAIMKGILYDHYSIPQSVLNSSIYPGSSEVKNLSGLII